MVISKKLINYQVILNLKHFWNGYMNNITIQMVMNLEKLQLCNKLLKKKEYQI